MRVLLLPPIVCIASIALMVVLHLKFPMIELLPQPFNWIGIVLLLAGLGRAQSQPRLCPPAFISSHTMRMLIHAP